MSQEILLNPGDNIYCVYESVIQYNDNWWYLLDYFHDILFDSDWECANFISFHLDRESAEQAANKFHLQEISIQHRICIYDLRDIGESSDYFRKDFNYIFEWCESHEMPFKLPDEDNSEEDPRKKNEIALLLEGYVEECLVEDKKHTLLAQLWLDAVGRFAFVQPMVVQETTYMRLEDNI